MRKMKEKDNIVSGKKKKKPPLSICGVITLTLTVFNFILLILDYFFVTDFAWLQMIAIAFYCSVILAFVLGLIGGIFAGIVLIKTKERREIVNIILNLVPIIAMSICLIIASHI
ncbi:MAG: hypothetical protein FWD82_09645 [Defluviitaleaceae bacterium]|nr:hypothetical protein [Defluviitaleaceae bacterium]